MEHVLLQAALLPGTGDFVRKTVGFWKQLFPRQRSCLGQVTSSKKSRFAGKVLPQAAQLPQTGDFFKKKSISWKKSAPGSAAAPDR